jgi:hypothetical protein
MHCDIGGQCAVCRLTGSQIYVNVPKYPSPYDLKHRQKKSELLFGSINKSSVQDSRLELTKINTADTCVYEYIPVSFLSLPIQVILLEVEAGTIYCTDCILALST